MFLNLNRNLFLINFKQPSEDKVKETSVCIEVKFLEVLMRGFLKEGH